MTAAVNTNILHIRICCQIREDLLENSGFGPFLKPFIHGLPWTISFSSMRAGFQDPLFTLWLPFEAAFFFLVHPTFDTVVTIQFRQDRHLFHAAKTLAKYPNTLLFHQCTEDMNVFGLISIPCNCLDAIPDVHSNSFVLILYESTAP